MALRRIAGWLLTALVCMMFVFAGLGQAAGAPPFVQMWHAFGYPYWFMVVTGILEIVGAALLVVPSTARFGAALLSVIMLGAVATHITHAQSGYAPMPAFFAALTIAAVWLRNTSQRGSRAI